MPVPMTTDDPPPDAPIEFICSTIRLELFIDNDHKKGLISYLWLIIRRDLGRVLNHSPVKCSMEFKKPCFRMGKTLLNTPHKLIMRGNVI